MAIMLRFFDNTLGCLRCVLFSLESLQQATGSLLFQAIDKHFQLPGTLGYNNLVGLGTNGANAMLGRHSSVFSRLKANQHNIVTLHCNCHIAALVANAACTVLPDDLEQLTTDVFYYLKKALSEYENYNSFRFLLIPSLISY